MFTTRDCLLLPDSVLAHQLLFVQQTLTKHSTAVLLYMLYYPNLASCDLHIHGDKRQIFNSAMHILLPEAVRSITVPSGLLRVG